MSEPYYGSVRISFVAPEAGANLATAASVTVYTTPAVRAWLDSDARAADEVTAAVSAHFAQRRHRPPYGQTRYRTPRSPELGVVLVSNDPESGEVVVYLPSED